MKIFLIGFMGSGKSHWGRIWGKINGLEFFDLDELIEKKENRSIKSIFEEQGENYFRDKETEILKSFAGKENYLVACGGGIPCFNNNMEWMNEHGTTIYLLAKAQNIYDRVLNETKERPLLTNIPAEDLFLSIQQKINEREHFYCQAKFILPVNELNDNSLSILNL